MVHFCEAVVQEIKSASDLDDVEDIVSNSLVLFRERKFQKEEMYVINMIVILRVCLLDLAASQSYSNVMHAIEIFRNYQRRTSKFY